MVVEKHSQVLSWRHQGWRKHSSSFDWIQLLLFIYVFPLANSIHWVHGDWIELNWTEAASGPDGKSSPIDSTYFFRFSQFSNGREGGTRPAKQKFKLYFWNCTFYTRYNMYKIFYKFYVALILWLVGDWKYISNFSKEIIIVNHFFIKDKFSAEKKPWKFMT